MYVMYYLFPPL